MPVPVLRRWVALFPAIQQQVNFRKAGNKSSNGRRLIISERSQAVRQSTTESASSCLD